MTVTGGSQATVVRREIPEDQDAVRALNEAAFAGPAEAAIVDAVRSRCSDAVSLVAVEGDRIVGHILFSPVEVTGDDGIAVGMGLGPMAVLPERQRRGIGSVLVRVGLELLSQQGCPFVVVIGHPAFYPRFGFEPASSRDISCQWDSVPDEAFMIFFPSPSGATNISGRVRYRDEFDIE